MQWVVYDKHKKHCAMYKISLQTLQTFVESGGA